MQVQIILVACLLSLCGCTVTAIPPETRLQGGESVTVEYTCRTPTGELAATTQQDVIKDMNQPPSPLFQSLGTYQPVVRTVPAQPQDFLLDKTMSFEEMLERLLVRHALGASRNIPLTLKLEGELIGGLDNGDRYLTLNRTFHQQRRLSVAKTVLEKDYGTLPVAGTEVETRMPGVTLRVEAQDGDTASILYSARPGTFIPSPFGEGEITHTEEDTFTITTKVQPGTLVRSGDMVGRITEVNDKTFTIDYGHSSAFTPLTCEVTFKPCASPDGH